MRKLPRKRTIAAVILICGTIVLILMAVRFIRHRLKYATTDAVFIRTDSLTNLGFEGVGGRITGMNKNEGETVAVGETLAVIDDTQFRLEVERLSAELEEARNELAKRRLTRIRLASETRLNVGIADDEVNRLQAERASIDAKAASLAAEITQLERDRDRYKSLAEAKVVAPRRVEDLETQLAARNEEKSSLEKQAMAVVAAAAGAGKKVKLADSNQLLVKETEEAIKAQTRKIAALGASLEQARDKLSKCTLKSPIDGRVARRFASPGDVMGPGRAVYALLNPKDVFAVALLEESKLDGVAAGSQVDLTLDAYPDRKFAGVVREVMPASAATFALVPRDISAGEFTKVAQRIPVRIAITEGDLDLLRVGLGGEVEIKRQS